MKRFPTTQSALTEFVCKLAHVEMLQIIFYSWNLFMCAVQSGSKLITSLISNIQYAVLIFLHYRGAEGRMQISSTFRGICVRFYLPTSFDYFFL